MLNRIHTFSLHYHSIGFISSPTATKASIYTSAPLGKSATAMAVLAGYDLSAKYDPYMAFTFAKSLIFYTYTNPYFKVHSGSDYILHINLNFIHK